MDQSDLELMDLPAFSSHILGVKAYVTMSGYTSGFVTWILGMKVRSSAYVEATLPTEVLPAPSAITPKASMSD